MAIFKSKAGPDKREAVFHGCKTIATIVGTFQTEDEGLIGMLTSLGYERADDPSVKFTPAPPSDIPYVVPDLPSVEPVVTDHVPHLFGEDVELEKDKPAKAKRKLGGKH